MVSSLLGDLLIIFGISIPVVFIFSRLKIAPLVGFLLAGILAGPFGFGLIQEGEKIELLAEIGVVLLLFTIGIEFSLRDLLKLKRIVLIGGGLQLSITTLLIAFIFLWLGYSQESSIFMGLLVSLSSTAIVLKLLQERGEMYSAHGRIALGILIFQDVAAVVIILLTPLLAGVPGTETAFFQLILQGLGLVLFTLVSARYIVPYLMYQIARTRNSELFLLSVVVIGLSVAWLTSMTGLSLALGAFLAGLIISESEYATQALGNVIPFRDMFVSIFFVSIGLLLDLDILREHLFLILAATFAVMFLKAVVNALSTFLIGFPLHTMVLVGLSLSQVGEFSLILANVGFANGLVSSETYQEFLNVAVISMVLTPFIMGMGHQAAAFAQELSLPQVLKSGWYKGLVDYSLEKGLENHLVIIGYGVNGRNVAIAARAASIPYSIIDINPDTVRKEKSKGEHIMYGDAAQKAVLEHAGIRDAKSVVVTAGDPVSAKRIIEAARRLNPEVHIIARTHFLSELERFYALGADEVISDEFESSIELFSRVLNRYMVPDNEIETVGEQLRADHYRILRSPEMRRKSICELSLDFSEVDIRSIRVGKYSKAAGQTLGSLQIRKKYGVSVLAISRIHRLMYDLGAETGLNPDDILLVISPPERLEEFKELFEDQV
ncbi:Glutathione-regulated potassium-efflux system protein KefC [Methanosarcina lacustris Z-7289]|uniref:Glutathione-regulated potassium-efflux system protein KefC n=1 Tax=Methanosarcina lacustris Z-7289 TaxID=1434111 RepID=A0A0E3S4P3_9EURY|nr:cation:proton antiporter [Methanosarcina lacustris]AKB73828.1 Glutathione-regulated potassium-efflux system protein KefC [Methanosarcina lacustris Z-7289]